jgi:hypothetical protein
LLLEISVCPVPCNPSALTEARSIGIDTAPLIEWAEKVLDTGDTVFLPKTELEGLRKQAGAVERHYYVQANTEISPDFAKALSERVKKWRADPSDVLVLGASLELRTAGDPDGGTLVVTPEPVIEPKAGRKVSAKTRAKLMEAVNMHSAATKCVMEAMGEDDGDGEDPEDDNDDEPNGSVVLESAPIEVTLTPTEQRIKEARELRAALPTND